MVTISNSAHCESSFHRIIARHGRKIHILSFPFVPVMSDPTFPAFPTLALLGAVLVLIPFPWHLQAWNSGTCLYMLWTSLGLINLAINSVIWRSSVVDYAPVWCDICKCLSIHLADRLEGIWQHHVSLSGWLSQFPLPPFVSIAASTKLQQSRQQRLPEDRCVFSDLNW